MCEHERASGCVVGCKSSVTGTRNQGHTDSAKDVALKLFREHSIKVKKSQEVGHCSFFQPVTYTGSLKNHQTALETWQQQSDRDKKHATRKATVKICISQLDDCESVGTMSFHMLSY